MTFTPGEPSRPRPRPLPPHRDLNIVEHRTFRRRRLVDAACALPLLGWVLWWLPLFWSGAETPVPASFVLIYIFGIWLALALIAARLVRLIQQERIPDQGAEAGERP